MSDMQGPQPTAEHIELQKSVGKWNVVGKFCMPDGQQIESQGTEVIEALGPFWTHCHYESEMFGMPYVGRGQLGFDPWKKHYVSTWIDSTNGSIFIFRGDMVGDTMTLEGEGADFTTGEPVQYKTVEKITHDRREFTMFMRPNGATEHITMFELIYTRSS